MDLCLTLGTVSSAPSSHKSRIFSEAWVIITSRRRQVTGRCNIHFFSPRAEIISKQEFLLSYLRGKESGRINQQSSKQKAQWISEVLGNIFLFCFSGLGWVCSSPRLPSPFHVMMYIKMKYCLFTILGTTGEELCPG